jgi:hypothetical protein
VSDTEARPILRARGLRKHYGQGEGLVRAVGGSTSTSTSESRLEPRRRAARGERAATIDVLRLFEDLHQAGQTLVVVTHDERIAWDDPAAGLTDGTSDVAFIWPPPRTTRSW